MSRKGKLKIGDDVLFKFAGTIENGKIIKIKGEGTSLRYIINDGKFSYPITHENISK